MAVTSGVPVVMNLACGAISSSASSRPSPTMTWIPDCRSCSSPLPLTCGLGSTTDAQTFRHTRRDYRLCAGRSASMVGAGFEGNVERGTARKLPRSGAARLSRRGPLRRAECGLPRRSGLLSPPPPRPARIRTSAADRRARQLQRTPHECVWGMGHCTGATTGVTRQ